MKKARSAKPTIKLSDIPLELLVNKENWLTSATGKKGKLIKIEVHPDGCFFQTYLTLEWEGGVVSPAVKFPEECELVTVDVAMVGGMYPSYKNYSLAALDRVMALRSALRSMKPSV